MTDDDKTPVDTTCGAPIRDRSGRDLGYVCNLTRGHLGRHAEVYQEAQTSTANDTSLEPRAGNAK